MVVTVGSTWEGGHEDVRVLILAADPPGQQDHLLPVRYWVLQIVTELQT